MEEDLYIFIYKGQTTKVVGELLKIVVKAFSF
jgi:hypothetical protein